MSQTASCTAEQRGRVRWAAAALEETEAVLDVEVIEPAESRFDRWTVDAVLRGPEIPPGVLKEIAICGLSIRPTPSQDASATVVATV